MDVLVIGLIVCVAWMALAVIVATLCRAAARIDAEADRLGEDLLRSHDRRRNRDPWRPAAL
jgi:hypothetical protein